jgi:glutathione S-transferase
VLSRTQGTKKHPHLTAYQQRLNERPAYQRAIAKGGPVVM